MKNNTVFVKGNLKVHIRWANVTDASNIARLELNASHYENRKEPFTFTHPQFTALWENRLSDENYRTIESGKILALYIDPLYMRLGIGKLLLQTAEQMVRIKGGSSIEVDVEVLNKRAISFYTSLQFAKVSVKLDHLIVMRKEFYNA